MTARSTQMAIITNVTCFPDLQAKARGMLRAKYLMLEFNQACSAAGDVNKVFKEAGDR